MLSVFESYHKRSTRKERMKAEVVSSQKLVYRPKSNRPM